VLRHTGQVVVWAALVAVLCLLVVLVVVPRVAGWVPLTVASGSMGSSIPTGSQVVVEPVHGQRGVAQVSPGDVVTFLPRPATRRWSPTGSCGWTGPGTGRGW
jgi:signal peptidase